MIGYYEEWFEKRVYSYRYRYLYVTASRDEIFDVVSNRAYLLEFAQTAKRISTFFQTVTYGAKNEK